MAKVQCEKILMTKQKDGSSVLLLQEKYGRRQLPIVIGQAEAFAITIAMEKQTTPRPLTHDLAISLLDHLGAVIVEVVVTELQENTFYALIFIEANGARIEVDARPSDAIALAVRSQSPVFVEEKVFEAAGLFQDDVAQSLSSKDKTAAEEGIKLPKKSELEILQDQLEEAIRVEDYKKAQKIKEKIEIIRGGSV